MTIITKPLSEKKGDKIILPLVENDELANETLNPTESSRNVLILRTSAQRVSTITTLCLFMTALAVVGVGIMGGSYLYDQYIKVQQRSMPGTFEGWASIPMNDEMGDEAFEERFSLDMDQSYEKIDVPDFRDGRSGRFIHDFNTNITGIIDITGGRCFVMPLNRGIVLPPKSLFDLIHKMWDGYYKVNTEIVRETMRVVTPPLKDVKSIGNYIANECDGKPIYKLEKYVSGVVKRSADVKSDAMFAQFAGNIITEFDIMNMNELLEYENEKKD